MSQIRSDARCIKFVEHALPKPQHLQQNQINKRWEGFMGKWDVGYLCIKIVGRLILKPPKCGMFAFREVGEGWFGKLNVGCGNLEKPP